MQKFLNLNRKDSENLNYKCLSDVWALIELLKTIMKEYLTEDDADTEQMLQRQRRKFHPKSLRGLAK
jgi:hypothetical protein